MIGHVLNYLVDLFKSDTKVNTIEINDRRIVDTKKQNIYPIVSMHYLSKSEGVDTFIYSIRVYVLQQRDFRPEMQPDKLMADTNFIDNLNDTESILNNAINYIRRFDVDNNWQVVTSGFTPLTEYAGAALDGHVVDLAIEVPNTGSCGS